jgi:hypothetical protein
MKRVSSFTHFASKIILGEKCLNIRCIHTLAARRTESTHIIANADFNNNLSASDSGWLMKRIRSQAITLNFKLSASLTTGCNSGTSITEGFHWAGKREALDKDTDKTAFL